MPVILENILWGHMRQVLTMVMPGPLNASRPRMGWNIYNLLLRQADRVVEYNSDNLKKPLARNHQILDTAVREVNKPTGWTDHEVTLGNFTFRASEGGSGTVNRWYLRASQSLSDAIPLGGSDFEPILCGNVKDFGIDTGNMAYLFNINFKRL